MTKANSTLNSTLSARPGNIAKRSILAVAVTALAACSSLPPPNADLAEARATLIQARSNPAVAVQAPLELEKADQALARAQTSWTEDRDEAQTRHLAYLAMQKAKIAANLGAQRQTEDQIKNAGAERESVMAEADRQRAEAAEAAAQAAQRDVAVARTQTVQQMARAAVLERELAVLQAKQTDRGLVVTLQDVLFASGRASLAPGAQRTVDHIAAVLREHPRRRVLIEGYTDNVGSPEMNVDLSQRRAEALRRALLNRRVAPDRMEIRAHGEAMPIADNASAAGRTQNRRVEVLFSDSNGNFLSRQ